MIQIQALSDSYDLLMAAAQKLNPHEKSFNMNYLQPLKKTFSHKCMIVYNINCSASQHAWFHMHCAQATLKRVTNSSPL